MLLVSFCITQPHACIEDSQQSLGHPRSKKSSQKKMSEKSKQIVAVLGAFLVLATAISLYVNYKQKKERERIKEEIKSVTTGKIEILWGTIEKDPSEGFEETNSEVQELHEFFTLYKKEIDEKKLLEKVKWLAPDKETSQEFEDIFNNDIVNPLEKKSKKSRYLSIS